MNDVSHKYLSTDERRRAIAAAASALIVEKGTEALRTREVAARVGINIATLHYHVPTKEALIHLVIDSMKEAFIQQYFSNPREGLNPLELLKLEIAEFKDTMINRPDLLQLIDEMHKLGRVVPAVDDKMREMKVRWLHAFVEILECGKEQGLFRANLDPVAGAHMITGALYAFQYKPRRLLSLFDSVSQEIINSLIAVPQKD